MSHKSKRYSKKNKQNGKDKKSYINDMELIELLNIQLLSFDIYIVSDVLFYIFSVVNLNLAYEQNANNNFAAPYLIAIKASYLALEASAVSAKVDYIVYDKRIEKKNNENMDYSVEPEGKIAEASIYTILFFYFNFIAMIQIYNQQKIYNTMIDKELIFILKLQVIAYILRIIGDLIGVISTMESIDLIKSKYDGREGKNLRDPDILAVISARILLVERIILLYSNYMAYMYTRNSSTQNSNTLYITQANLIRVIGNIIGVYGGIIGLEGFVEIYKRNVVLPVFGR